MRDDFDAALVAPFDKPLPPEPAPVVDERAEALEARRRAVEAMGGEVDG